MTGVAILIASYACRPYALDLAIKFWLMFCTRSAYWYSNAVVWSSTILSADISGCSSSESPTADVILSLCSQVNDAPHEASYPYWQANNELINNRCYALRTYWPTIALQVSCAKKVSEIGSRST
eukprot:g28791.t1